MSQLVPLWCGQWVLSGIERAWKGKVLSAINYQDRFSYFTTIAILKIERMPGGVGNVDRIHKT